MEPIEKDIRFYNTIKNDLELNSTGKWVLVHNENLVNVFDSFESTATEAVRLFGRGPYLIRQVGRMPFVLPASVAFITRRNG